MPSFKSLGFLAALATAVVAYTPLEARNDMDFTPDDLDVLFGRAVDYDDDNFELSARDADFDADQVFEILARNLDIEELVARDPKGLSGLFSGIKKVASKVSDHKEQIKSVGRGASSAGNHAANAYGNIQSMQQAQLQTQVMQQQVAAPPMGYRKRSLYEEDPEMWY